MSLNIGLLKICMLRELLGLKIKNMTVFVNCYIPEKYLTSSNAGKNLTDVRLLRFFEPSNPNPRSRGLQSLSFSNWQGRREGVNWAECIHMCSARLVSFEIELISQNPNVRPNPNV